MSPTENQEWRTELRKIFTEQRNSFDNRLLAMAWGTLAALSAATITSSKLTSNQVLWGGCAGLSLLLTILALLAVQLMNAEYAKTLLSQGTEEDSQKAANLEKQMKRADLFATILFGLGLLLSGVAIMVTATAKTSPPSDTRKRTNMSKNNPPANPPRNTSAPTRRRVVREDSLAGLSGLAPKTKVSASLAGMRHMQPQTTSQQTGTENQPAKPKEAPPPAKKEE